MYSRPMPAADYVIWSHEHAGWWKPLGAGYTRLLDDAGLFSRERALDICQHALPGSRGVPNEIPVRLADLMEIRERVGLGRSVLG